ncbi:nuclear transport factor 2 family protein [Gemmatimonas sp.]|uniref:nuclear transport factor 2 family protein n=1 Tax=Gemmatimonas sp. TaxID=1962908 RepID=UPI00286A2CCA|nr:nuclear transport factor 2 family protein [Gemmatimonas sp.]
MNRFTPIRWSLPAALLASACGGPTPATSRADRLPFDLDATRRLITQQNARFTAAHVVGDLATIDSMFAPNAKSFPPGANAVSGLPALHAFTVEYLKAGVTEFREQTTDFYGNAEYVVDAGTYVVTYGPAHVTERGKYLNVWTQVNGTWKIKANMWNTDAPDPTSK